MFFYLYFLDFCKYGFEYFKHFPQGSQCLFCFFVIFEEQPSSLFDSENAFHFLDNYFLECSSNSYV